MESPLAVRTSRIPAFIRPPPALSLPLIVPQQPVPPVPGASDYLDCSLIVSNQLLLLIFELLGDVLQPPLCSELLPAALLSQGGNGRLELGDGLQRQGHAVTCIPQREACFIRAYARQEDSAGKTQFLALNIVN